MIYFIADLHFHHENVIAFSHRPYQKVEEMNEQYLKDKDFDHTLFEKVTNYHTFKYYKRKFVLFHYLII